MVQLVTGSLPPVTGFFRRGRRFLGAVSAEGEAAGFSGALRATGLVGRRPGLGGRAVVAAGAGLCLGRL